MGLSGIGQSLFCFSPSSVKDEPLSDQPASSRAPAAVFI